MTKLRFVPGLLFVLFLSSCEQVDGPLVVKSPMKLKGAFGQLVSLTPGSYDSSISMSDDDRFMLKVNFVEDSPFPPGEDDRNEVSEFKFLVPPGVELPHESGSVYLPAGQNGQPMDLRGELNTSRWDSDMRNGYEYCHYDCQEWVCYGRGGRCQWERRQCQGQRYVEYYVKFEKRDVAFQLLAPGQTSGEKADFSGSKTFSERVYSTYGRCR